MFVATSKLNSASRLKLFRLGLTGICWIISFLCVSSTVTEESRKNEQICECRDKYDFSRFREQTSSN